MPQLNNLSWFSLLTFFYIFLFSFLIFFNFIISLFSFFSNKKFLNLYSFFYL